MQPGEIPGSWDSKPTDIKDGIGVTFSSVKISVVELETVATALGQPLPVHFLVLEQMDLELTLERAQSKIWWSKSGRQTVPGSQTIHSIAALANEGPSISQKGSSHHGTERDWRRPLVDATCTICAVFIAISLTEKCRGILEAAAESYVHFWAWQSTKHERGHSQTKILGQTP